MSIHRRVHNLILAFLSFVVLPGASVYAQKSSTSYTFTDLGGLPGLSYVESEPLAINDFGEIVGWSNTAGPTGAAEQHAVIWAKDASGKYVITDLGRGGAGAINNLGEVLAQGGLIVPVTVNGSLVWYQDLNGDGINDLLDPDIGGHAINNITQIVEGYDVAQYDANGNVIVTPLPNGGVGNAINDSGQVAGETGDGTFDAAIWHVDTTGTLVASDTVPLLPLAGANSATALCIDALGRAAGYSNFPVSTNPPASRPRATVWLGGSTPTDLGAPSNSSSIAYGASTVNSVLQVVGSYDGRAFLWKNGKMTALSASSVNLTGATAINSKGQIVGTARVSLGKGNVEIHAFLLTPK